MGSIKFLIVITVFLCAQNALGQVSLQAKAKRGSPFYEHNDQVKTLRNIRKPWNNGTVLNDPTRPWRLTQDILPVHYELTLTPILDEEAPISLGLQWTTPGFVRIAFNVVNPTNKIVLHMKDIEEIHTTVHLNNTILAKNGEDTYEAEYMFYTINLQDELAVGESGYSVEIHFISKVNEELHGLYRSSYVDQETGETRKIAITQMEALNAREVFPCFDEPFFKATFSITIGRHEKYMSLSNGQFVNSEPIPFAEDWFYDNFEDTVPQSTYLLAIVISDFTFEQAPGVILPETIVRTFAPKHSIDRQGGVYASEKAEQILSHFGEYFGQSYPMAKMDLAAVPDFYFGAMENFGLNIYREYLLLLFPGETTEAERYRLTQVLSHELAHQWFGNLVSPAWWTHIWLNEGMANFVEYIGMEAVAPEFKTWDLFVSDNLQYAMHYDSILEFSHPLKIDEEEWINNEAMSWFDQLTYEKGGSLARMMQGFLGTGPFQQGLRNYQEKMKFRSALQDDLFEELNGAATERLLPDGMTVKDIMSSWTLQSGYPVLSASLSEDGTNVDVMQMKFGDDASEQQWVVPVSVATPEVADFDPMPEYWMFESVPREISLSIPVTKDHWIILNAGVTGYYRVMYDDILLKLIRDQLEVDSTVIHHFSKSQLLDDYFNFAWKNSKSVSSALELTIYMKSEGEKEMVVWNTLLSHLNTPLNLLGSSGSLDDMKNYLLPRINLAIKELGGVDAIKTDSTGMDVLRHTQLLDWACALADEDCLAYSLQLVNEWKSDIGNNPVPVDLKAIVYCGAVAAGGVESFDFIYSLYKDSGTSVVERQLLLNALSCATQTGLISKLTSGVLEMEFYGDKSDGVTVLRGLAANLQARESLWTFLASNFDDLISFFGNQSPVTSTIAALSNFMSSQTELTELGQFITENQAVFEDSLDEYITAVQNNVNWVQEFGVPMLEFFVSQTDPEPTDEPTDPTDGPTTLPTDSPTTVGPTDSPTTESTDGPTTLPTDSPTTDGPTDSPTTESTDGPTDSPTTESTDVPTNSPTTESTDGPTDSPTTESTDVPTDSPTTESTDGPTDSPTTESTDVPTDSPTTELTDGPTDSPTTYPTDGPTTLPTDSPTTDGPTDTTKPTDGPTTERPDGSTTGSTDGPTTKPTDRPTTVPTEGPSTEGRTTPTTKIPSTGPTNSPSTGQTSPSTNEPTTDGNNNNNAYSLQASLFSIITASIILSYFH